MKALIASLGVLGLAASAAVAVSSPESAAPAAAPAGGTVTAKFTWDGKLPDPLKPLTIDAAKSQGCCPPGVDMDTTDRKRLIDKNGGISDVVVTLEPKGHEVEIEVREEPYTMDQQKCRFEPHLLVVPVGNTVVWKNSDSVNHNVNVKAKKNGSFNNNVASGGEEKRVMEHAETVSVGCDIHPWMGATVFVTDTPFAAQTGRDGTFTLEGVTPGTYKVEWWHESLGKGKLDDITVADGGTVEIAEKLKEKSSGGRRRR